MNTQSFWKYGLYWVILSFLSCLFFLPLSKEVDYSAEDKFISSNSVTSINKATLKINSYIPYQPNLFFYQTLPTFCWPKFKLLKFLTRYTNKASNSFLEFKAWLDPVLDARLCRTTMGRGGKTWVKTGNTFVWLEIYEPIAYFFFSSRIFENRNMLLNILILVLMLTIKSIKMKETTINSSILPTPNL